MMLKMKTNLSIQLFTFFILVILGTSGYSQPKNFELKVDELLLKQYMAGEPGAVALVAKKGEVIYKKAFGMANMELDIPMRTDMIFEIGSITKQVTAVAILMLMEEGKLNLEDDITKYIGNYPVHGHKINIHHLLTHTSGLNNYTNIEEWTHLWRQDYTPSEFIDIIKKFPMDFTPGEKWNYSNTAYFILGYIIEKASGIPYPQFIQEKIFAPLGMKNSMYGSHSKIIKNRASGYQKTDSLVNAEYLSMTQPYAAGALMSTVEDLYIWNKAVQSYKLIKEETTKKAFTNYTLNNGDPINYGYGWKLSEINGSPTVEHSGGIFGYLTNGIYLPNEDVYVIILSNSGNNSPINVSTKIAALAIGKPYSEKRIEVGNEKLKELTGVYVSKDKDLIFTVIDGQLYLKRDQRNKFKLFPESETKFYFENGIITVEFIRNTSGEVIEAVIQNRESKEKALKTDKTIPVQDDIKQENKSISK